MEALLILLLLGGVAASIYFIAESRGGVESATVDRNPTEVISLAVAQVPVGTASLRSSWMPAGHAERSASFVYKRRPSILLAFLLLWLFVVPGILYIVFGGKSQTLQVDILSTPGEGATLVQVASTGGVARRRGRKFLDQIQDRALADESPASTLPVGAN